MQYIFKYPGDPETPGVASTLDLPDSARVSAYGNEPHIISIPISYHDAAPILQALQRPQCAAGVAGCAALPLPPWRPGRRTVHLVSQQDYQRRIIWDVIGKIKGSEYPDEWVIAGNHRDAWVYGAVDPSSGTAAMLESVHGLGALLKQGWRPKRTIVFCSWDAEEEGLIGSTEWVEQNAQALQHAVAYFNTDVAVSGAGFHRLRRPLAQALPPRADPLGSQPAGRHGLSAVAAQPSQPRTSTTAPMLRPRPARRSRSAILAPAPTFRPSSARSAFPPPTSAPTGLTASTTRSSTTTPGTR